MRLRVKSAFLLTLLVATATNAWSADGRILSIEGDVRVNGQPVTVDTLLQSEDTITTAAGASVRIVLSDNSVLDLDSESEIQLSDYSYTPDEPENNTSDISVVEGSLRYVSGLIAKDNPENISFEAGNATIGIRGSFTGIEVDDVVVKVEAMIGEATLRRKGKDGKTDKVIVPTGQATRTDPSTGEVLVVPSEVIDPVNAVVRAIAAAAPDATDSRDEGCSRGKNPLRATAKPHVDKATTESIEKQLAALSEGDLIMVIAVLRNNARHLCIDSVTIAAAVEVVSKVNPDVADVVVDLLDPDNSETPETPETTDPGTPPPPETDLPPGGGADPSPE